MKQGLQIMILIISLFLIWSCNEAKDSVDKSNQVTTKEIHSLQIIWLQDGTGSSSTNYVGTITEENIDIIVKQLTLSGGEFCFGLISDSHTDQLRRLSIPLIPQKEKFCRSDNPLIDEQEYSKYRLYEQSIDSLIREYEASLKRHVDDFKNQIHDLIGKPLAKSTDYNSAISRASTAFSEPNGITHKILIMVSDSEDNRKVRPLPENINAEIIIVNPFPPEIAKKYGAQCFEGIPSAVNYLIQNFGSHNANK
jgi:hypothetical protein